MSSLFESCDVSRRNFLIGSTASGLGLAIGFALSSADAKAADAKANEAAAEEVNAWVLIEPDDTVIIRIARSEMGQGTLTGLAQMVAEELECDWNKVTTEYPTPGQNLARGRVWGSFSTGGSRGIRNSHDYVRKGGAAAREMLIGAAAEAWGVPAVECRAADSVVRHPASGRSARFGELAQAASKREPPADVTLKNPSDWKLIGKPLPRLDTADKLTGKQIYGVDFTLPGMLCAAIKQCPVFGGKLASYDEDAVAKMPGVRQVVKVDDSAVAVVAETWWQAKRAIDALPVEWDEGENAKVSSASISKFLDEGLAGGDAFVGNQVGDAKSVLETSANTLEATYSYPFQNHATMEPMNATARWSPERCEVWCPTQNGEAALAAAAAASGLEIEQCEVYKIHLGGGFGRRGAFHDYVQQVVSIAKQMPGAPIKLIWSREEDMTQGRYHPVTKAKLVGGLDGQGKLQSLHVRISGQSILAAVMPGRMSNGADMVTFQGLLPSGDHSISYSVPNLLVEHAMRNTHVPPGFWRGVNINQNAIYLECFVDELAHAAGSDPLEFRRSLMGAHPKSLAVLEAVAERAGWGTPAAAGVHRGLAQCKAFGSHIAACAEVSVSEKGELKLHRIVAATDPGYVVNPQQVEAQVQGSFVYGLSAMLYGQCTVSNGRIEQRNFDSYPSLRIAQMPEVEVIVMPSGGFWGGVGEPTIAVAAPAVLNAIFAATGTRIRELPLLDQKLRAS